MVKLDDELRYGAMLGVMQGDLDKMRMALRFVVNELLKGKSTLEARLQSEGKSPSSDEAYQRYWQLSSLFGGLSMMLDGVDGVMSGTVCELLRGTDDDGE